MKFGWVVMGAVLAVGRLAAAESFAWGVPCRVPVNEVRLGENGATVKMKYVVSLTEAATGDELQVRIEDLTFLAVNGKADAVPRLQETLRMTFESPTIRITRSGAFVGIADMDKLVDLLAQMSIFKGPPENTKRLRAMMMSPAFAARRTRELDEQWTAWVGAWAGRVPELKQSLELTQNTTFSDGTLAIPAKLTRLDTPGTEHLRLDSHVHSQALATALGTVFEASKTTPGVVNYDKPTDAERWLEIEAKRDPVTHRPRETRFDDRRHMTYKDGHTSDEHHQSLTTFDWQAAQGACADKPR